MPTFLKKLWRKRWIKLFVAIVLSLTVYIVAIEIHNSQIDDNEFRQRLEDRGSLVY